MKHIRRYKTYESKSDVKELLNDLIDFDNFDIVIENRNMTGYFEIKIDKGWNGHFTMTDLLKSTLIRFNNVMSADWTIAYKYTPYNHGGSERFYFYDDERGIRANGHRLLDEKIWFITILMQEKK